MICTKRVSLSRNLAKMQIGNSIKKQLRLSPVLLSVIEGFIMRLLLGPDFQFHPEYDEKAQEYRDVSKKK